MVRDSGKGTTSSLAQLLFLGLTPSESRPLTPGLLTLRGMGGGGQRQNEASVGRQVEKVIALPCALQLRVHIDQPAVSYSG